MKSFQNPYKFQPKFGLDFCLVSGAFFIDFWGVLGSLDPPKWVSRLGEVLFFGKSRFSSQMQFWLDFLWMFKWFWSVFGSENPSKNQAKNATDFKRFLMDFRTHFGSKWGPCWLHFRLQKIIEILLRFSAPLADLPLGTPRLIAYPHISRYMYVCT